MILAAVDRMAAEHGDKTDADRLVCVAYAALLSSCAYEGPGRQIHDLGLPPFLVEEIAIDAAGTVGSQVSLGTNKRLHRALDDGSGPVPRNLARELPGAILDEYGEPAGHEPQGRELLSRITRRIEKLGGEAAIRPQKVASRSPAVAPESSESERETELERTEILDALEKEAKLSPQQAEVWRRLRRDMSIEEIAAELGTTKNTVSVQKNHALRKLRRVAKAAELR